jgi:hypothetical protein
MNLNQLPRGVVAGVASAAFIGGNADAYLDWSTPPAHVRTAELRDGYIPMSARQERVVRNAFGVIQSYWVNQEHVDVSGTTIQILKGDEEAPCDSLRGHEFTVSATELNAYECPELNKVIVSEHFVSELSHARGVKTREGSDALLKQVVSHELGHAVQHAKNPAVSKTATASIGAHAKMELQADCYGGQAIAEIGPEDVKPASHFFTLRKHAHDPAHGTYLQRQNNFMRGAKTGKC